MKISTFHKQRGDEVVFYKGCSPNLAEQTWGRIYISTLFTFYWDITLKTIKYYSGSVKKTSDIFVGGVMATLMKNEIEDEVKVTVVEGLLNEKGKLGYKTDDRIDSLVPDYSIVDKKSNSVLNYSYPTNDSYIAYATRGCIRKCQFCAVPIIEPAFKNSLSIAAQVKSIKSKFGGKRHLLLLDNNILASDDFPQIIEEIKSLGFERGAKYALNTGKKIIQVERYVDFNQGIDARLLTREKMELLSKIAVKPLRIAFDNIKYKDMYIEKTRLAAEYGIKRLSNYILFNFRDTPQDFYERLKINIELNEEFVQKGYKSHVWSFPMKYSPITGEHCKDRKYIGEHWNKKYLRGIQCVLLVTHGVVGPKKQFFEKAFGRNVEEFLKILTLPEDFIIYRNRHEDNGDMEKFNDAINSLSKEQRHILTEIVLSNNFIDVQTRTTDRRLLDILDLYRWDRFSN